MTIPATFRVGQQVRRRRLDPERATIGPDTLQLRDVAPPRLGDDRCQEPAPPLSLLGRSEGVECGPDQVGGLVAKGAGHRRADVAADTVGIGDDRQARGVEDQRAVTCVAGPWRRVALPPRGDVLGYLGHSERITRLIPQARLVRASRASPHSAPPRGIRPRRRRPAPAAAGRPRVWLRVVGVDQVQAGGRAEGNVCVPPAVEGVQPFRADDRPTGRVPGPIRHLCRGQHEPRRCFVLA